MHKSWVRIPTVEENIFYLTDHPWPVDDTSGQNNGIINLTYIITYYAW